MAKMNKSEAVVAAKNFAMGININKTPAEIVAMSYDEQVRYVAELLAANPFACPEVQQPQYLNAANEAVADTLRSRIMQKGKTLSVARNNWKHAVSRGITTEEAAKRVADLLNSMNIRGANPVDPSEWNISFTVRRQREEIRMYISFDRDYDSKHVNPDNANQAIFNYRAKLEISTSGTSRSLAGTTTLMNMLTEVTAAAAEVETLLESMSVVYKWGFDKAEDVKNAEV